MVAEGKVRWAFWPPSARPPTSTAENGIWIPGEPGQHIEDDSDEDEDEDDEDDGTDDTSDDHGSEGDAEYRSDDGEETEEDKVPLGVGTRGRFAALNLRVRGESESDDGAEEER